MPSQLHDGLVHAEVVQVAGAIDTRRGHKPMRMRLRWRKVDDPVNEPSVSLVRLDTGELALGERTSLWKRRQYVVYTDALKREKMKGEFNPGSYIRAAPLVRESPHNRRF